MKVEIVTRTEGVGKYKGLSTEEITSAIARHGVVKEDQGRLVKHLMDNKHWSPLDMINFAFEVETSRSIGRQLLRHWSIKPQEHSQRYSKRVEFENIEIRMEHPTNRQSSTDVFDPIIKTPWGDELVLGEASEAIDSLLYMIEKTYFAMIEAGVAKECARDILPGCTKTTITMNGSLRSWLSFLNVRMDDHSQKEVVLIAKEVGEALEKEMPKVFSTIDWRNGMFM